ncbi:MAG: hypothetical protein M9938_02285 [Solirubrobacterales bacterium]|nr:hypothetical protein [Solirubrobacterales bacterium]
MARYGLVAVLAALLFAALPASPATAQTPPPVSNWVLTGSKEYLPVAGSPTVCGSQGLTSDGESLWFSWNFGFSHNDLNLTRTFDQRCSNSIPPNLLATGHDHIGGIDLHEGIIYAPIEDGANFLSPWIVLYRASDLAYTGTAFALDRAYLTEGVPWVAIDGPRGVAYTAEAHNTTVLNVHRLSDFHIIRTVTLNQEVPDIQGAKMFRGLLYYSQDNGPRKSIGALDPETGHVTNLFDRDLGNGYEAEGLTFVQRRSGTEMLAIELYKGTKGDPNDPFHARLQRYRINGDTTPPRLAGLRLKPKQVRSGKRPARIAVAVRSSEPATITGQWQRCTGPRRNPCRKLKTAGSPFTRSLGTGPNRFRIKAVNGTRNPKPGRWQLRLTPTDEAGVTGKPARASIRVLPPRRGR